MTKLQSWLIPDDVPVDWRTKAFGPAQRGLTIRELVERRTTVADLPTPLLTLDIAAMNHNIDVMQSYLDAHGVMLAPHGKTSMSPQLWKRQLGAGAWGITVATPWQLRVAIANGVPRVMHAGAMLTPGDLADVSRLLTEDPGRSVLVWTDSVASATLIAEHYPVTSPPLQVLVDRGGPGSRTGARTLNEAIDTCEVIAGSPHLQLAGIAAWEGSQVGTGGPNSRQLIADFCDLAAETFEAALTAGLFEPMLRPIITGGGSAYFDIVVERWSRLKKLGADIVLRSGCYLTHDDGSYAQKSPFAQLGPGALTPALHLWGQVVSRPERGLALLNTGRRDAPYDDILPVPQRLLGHSRESSAAALRGATVMRLNDQHAYLSLANDATLQVGDVVRCGIAHPCTAFDKWAVVPVIDDAQADLPVMVGAIRTIF